MSTEPFQGRVVERTHRIALAGSPDEVFALFGPVREGDWAAGWDPEVVAGDGESPEAGCVFRTSDETRGETVWLLADVDPTNRRIRYVRTTPRSDLAVIHIAVDPAPDGTCSATVTYRLTGLTREGNAFVARFTAERYRELIGEWATAIDHFLATGQARHTAL